MTATGHPTAAAILARILAEPREDTHRLVYADWLEENGDPARAEFVRDCVSVLARHTDCPVRLADLTRSRPVPLRCGACDYCQSRRRAERFHSRYSWFGGNYAVCFEPTPLDGPVPDGPGLTLVVSRGFVSAVRCPLADWLRHGPAVVRAHPVEWVTLNDREPMELARRVRGHDSSWAAPDREAVYVWYRATMEACRTGEPDYIPDSVFYLMPGCTPGYTLHPSRTLPLSIRYDSRADALAALFAAALAWAKAAPVRPA